MRLVFLVPDFDPSRRLEHVGNFAAAHRMGWLSTWIRHHRMPVSVVHGGTLNLIRHAWVARRAGFDVVLATVRGRDTYGDRAPHRLPFIRWRDRRPDDICVIPDFVSHLADQVAGRAIVYLQSPNFLSAVFDHRSPRVRLWTDSEHMLGLCRAAYPGAAITIVPNVVDAEAFPFVPQARREPGLVFAFPRKGADFIDATQARYAALGGRHWRIERLDGLTFQELVRQFRRPQVFLASAPIEGCALPPQESMAAGIIVVGRTAAGANFYMAHRETAMVAETPDEAARALLELEDAALRDHIAQQAHRSISRFFPDGEPSDLWRGLATELGRDPHATPTLART